MPRCEMCAEWPDCPWKTDPDIMCGEYHPKPITNADRIRMMSDEELAYFIACDYYVPHCPIEDGCLGDHDGCDGCWLEWLRQEARYEL